MLHAVICSWCDACRLHLGICLYAKPTPTKPLMLCRYSVLHAACTRIGCFASCTNLHQIAPSCLLITYLGTSPAQNTSFPLVPLLLMFFLYSVPRHNTLQWRQVVAVTAGCLLLCNLHRSTFAVLLPDLAAQLGLTASQAGAVQAAMLAAYLVGQVPAGRLADMHSGTK
jgi:hypothetical protein